MKLVTFALFDTKVGNYGQPFFFNHIASCTRALAELLSDPANLAARYPADYQLHQLAEFDDATGGFDRVFINHGTLVTFIDTRRQPELPILNQVRDQVAIAGTPMEDR